MPLRTFYHHIVSNAREVEEQDEEANRDRNGGIWQIGLERDTGKFVMKETNSRSNQEARKAEDLQEAIHYKELPVESRSKKG
ncbi:hypothetical protein QE152_g14281 [Popillia japonica]|uniref:Uncharacterized protein n=1 Tax=Popillia japonica TaxID=7064 RepID=A0AAW1L709_POPJA